MRKNIGGIFIHINQYFLFFEKYLLRILLFMIIVLAFSQIASRNLFDTGFIWIDPVVKLCVLWVAFIGASLAMESKGHIKIDFLYHIIRSEGARRRIEIVAQISTILICSLLFAAAVGYVCVISSDPRATVIPGIPDWSLRSVIPYSFFVMVMRCTIHTVNLITKEEKGQHAG